MNSWHLDVETFSAAPLADCGAFRYACDPSTELLLLAIACDDDPPLVWDRYAPVPVNAPAMALIMDMLMDEGTITCHNIKFELAIMRYLWEKTFGTAMPEVSRLRCTQAMCNMVAIPSSLAKAAEFLKLGEAKDPRGVSLIHTFSIPFKPTKANPHTRITPDLKGKVTIAGEKMEIADAWSLFREYCIKDVVVEREIHKRLKPMELSGATLDAFQLDLAMCLRGVPVNLKAARYAHGLMEDYRGKVAVEFQELTGLKPTQTAKLLGWFQERGYPAGDLTAPTVSRLLTGVEVDDDGEETGEVSAPAELSPLVEKALRMRALLTFAAPKKITKMLTVACPDGRVRGMINFWGAARTGRSNSNFVQLQNMKRSTVPGNEDIYRALCAESVTMDDLDLVWGPPMECLASCVRHFLDLGSGRRMLGADLSQVESRVLAWLSGHTVKLKTFREGLDLYKVAVNLMWGTEYGKVSKSERQLGKICELSLGFQGGPGALIRMARNHGVELEEEKAVEVVKAFRKGNEPIVQLWKKCNEAAIEAIRNPGAWFAINNKLRIGVSGKLGFPVMFLELPSKRLLSYPLPELRTVYKIQDWKTKRWNTIPEYRALDADGDKRDGVWAVQEISYYGKLEGKSIWGRCVTHGGTICQNAVQANAGDLMWLGGVTAERAGFKCLFPVHDEQLTEYHPENGDSPEKLARCMETLPSWAKDFPTAAVGGIYDFYTKD